MAQQIKATESDNSQDPQSRREQASGLHTHSRTYPSNTSPTYTACPILSTAIHRADEVQQVSGLGMTGKVEHGGAHF